MRITSPTGNSVEFPDGSSTQVIDGRIFLARLGVDAMKSASIPPCPRGSGTRRRDQRRRSRLLSWSVAVVLVTSACSYEEDRSDEVELGSLKSAAETFVEFFGDEEPGGPPYHFYSERCYQLADPAAPRFVNGGSWVAPTELVVDEFTDIIVDGTIADGTKAIVYYTTRATRSGYGRTDSTTPAGDANQGVRWIYEEVQPFPGSKSEGFWFWDDC